MKQSEEILDTPSLKKGVAYTPASSMSEGHLPEAQLVGVGFSLELLLPGHLIGPLHRPATVLVLDAEVESLSRGLLLLGQLSLLLVDLP